MRAPPAAAEHVAPTALPVSPFADPLTGHDAELLRSDGAVAALDVGRWHGGAAGEDLWLLDRCHGPTIDLGCGPGRLVEALAARGLAALGVDVADEAVSACRRRGVEVLQAEVLGPLPGEGTWDHVLLADGNVGIGGDPARLLRRAARLLRPGGTVLVELDPEGATVWRGQARVRCRDEVGRAFPWATAGAGALPWLARRARLRVGVQHRGRRSFAELVATGVR